MKFDGNNWVYVGAENGFSAGGSFYTSIAVSPSDDQPYVVYADGGDSLKATVMKYDSVYVGINEAQVSGFYVYPNPATDKITIETPVTSINGQLSIMDVNGQQLITRQVTDPKTQIDISTLAAGIYFVRVTHGMTVETGKIIKQ